MTSRRLLGILLVCAVAAGQWVFHFHTLSHAKHEFALAKGAQAGYCPAPLDHSVDYCVALDAFGSGATASQPVVNSN